MGCDIHPAIEVLEDNTGHWWRFMAQPERARNYEFFALLAGVRGEVPDGHAPIAEGRGIPEHVDWTTYDVDNEEHCIVNGDHSASWFSLREAKAYDASWAHEWTQEQWARWIKTGEFFRALYGLSDDDVRFVFNFDS